MSTQTTKKKGFREYSFNNDDHWHEDPPNVFTSTDDAAGISFEFGQNDGQNHGPPNPPMKVGSKVTIIPGGPGEDDRAVITRVV